MIQKYATKYNVILGKLYKMERATLMFKCLGEHEIVLVLLEVHQGTYGNHIGW